MNEIIEKEKIKVENMIYKIREKNKNKFHIF